MNKSSGFMMAGGLAREIAIALLCCAPLGCVPEMKLPPEALRGNQISRDDSESRLRLMQVLEEPTSRSGGSLVWLRAGTDEDTLDAMVACSETDEDGSSRRIERFVRWSLQSGALIQDRALATERWQDMPPVEGRSAAQSGWQGTCERFQIESFWMLNDRNLDRRTPLIPSGSYVSDSVRLAFSPDCRYLAALFTRGPFALALDNTHCHIRVWDTSTGGLRSWFLVPDAGYTEWYQRGVIDWSADGRYVAASRPGESCVFDAESGESLVFRSDSEMVGGVYWVRGSSDLVVLQTDRIRVYSLAK